MFIPAPLVPAPQPFSTENPTMSLSFQGLPLSAQMGSPSHVPVNPCILHAPLSALFTLLCFTVAFVSTLGYKFLEGMGHDFSSSFSHDPLKYPTHREMLSKYLLNKLKRK